MNRLHATTSKENYTRPVSLVVTSATMILWTVISGIWLIWRGPGVPHSLVALVLGPLVGVGFVGFLWFYWNGYSWTRYLVLSSSALFAIDALFALTKFHPLIYLGAEANGSEYLNLFRLCISIYLFSWLLTPEASNYFSTDARHERKSLKSFRKLGSPLLR